MYAHENIFLAAHIPLDDGEVTAFVERVLVGDQFEMPILAREVHLRNPMDKVLRMLAVLDEILDGDDVIVRKQSTAKDGEIVIAMTSDNEATCKRFYKEPENKRYRLQPENDTMPPIYLDNVTILGKVIGLYRDHIF